MMVSDGLEQPHRLGSRCPLRGRVRTESAARFVVGSFEGVGAACDQVLRPGPVEAGAGGCGARAGDARRARWSRAPWGAVLALRYALRRREALDGSRVEVVRGLQIDRLRRFGCFVSLRFRHLIGWYAGGSMRRMIGLFNFCSIRVLMDHFLSYLLVDRLRDRPSGPLTPLAIEPPAA